MKGFSRGRVRRSRGQLRPKINWGSAPDPGIYRIDANPGASGQAVVNCRRMGCDYEDR
jgi:hypothetical protein